MATHRIIANIIAKHDAHYQTCLPQLQPIPKHVSHTAIVNYRTCLPHSYSQSPNMSPPQLQPIPKHVSHTAIANPQTCLPHSYSQFPNMLLTTAIICYTSVSGMREFQNYLTLFLQITSQKYDYIRYAFIIKYIGIHLNNTINIQLIC